MRKMRDTIEQIRSPGFVTKIEDCNGKLVSVTSAQQLSDSSHSPDIDANKRLLEALMAFFSCSEEQNSPTPMLWMNMIAVMPGVLVPNRNSNNTSIPKFPFFQMIDSHHISTILDAVIRAEEAIALRAIAQNPQALLEKWGIKNRLSITYEVTPAQAAVMATDVQMLEKMTPYFERLTKDAQGNSIDGLAIMQSQIKEIYTQSLQRHCDMQQAKIDSLQTQQQNGQATDEKALEIARVRLASYDSAIATDTFDIIFKAHKWAQKFNAFDFQPYVDAILNAPDAELNDVVALINAKTPAETEAAIAKGVSPIEIGFTDQQGRTYSKEEVQTLPFDQLTLIQKMNRFRETYAAYKKQQGNKLIDNSQEDILAALVANKKTWDTLPHTQDPNYKKRSIIWSQLVGFAQRHATKAMKQDFRQGIGYLTEDNQHHFRPSRFFAWDNNNIVRGVVDGSLSSLLGIDGVGYILAAGCASSTLIAGAVGLGCLGIFKTYFEQKQQAFRTFMPHSPVRTQNCRCVVA